MLQSNMQRWNAIKQCTSVKKLIMCKALKDVLKFGVKVIIQLF